MSDFIELDPDGRGFSSQCNFFFFFFLNTESERMRKMDILRQKRPIPMRGHSGPDILACDRAVFYCCIDHLCCR